MRKKYTIHKRLKYTKKSKIKKSKNKKKTKRKQRGGSGRAPPRTKNQSVSQRQKKYVQGHVDAARQETQLEKKRRRKAEKQAKEQASANEEPKSYHGSYDFPTQATMAADEAARRQRPPAATALEEESADEAAQREADEVALEEEEALRLQAEEIASSEALHLQEELEECERNLQKAGELGKDLVEKNSAHEKEVRRIKEYLGEWEEASRDMAVMMDGSYSSDEYLSPENISDMLDQYISTKSLQENELLDDLEFHKKNAKECLDKNAEFKYGERDQVKFIDVLNATLKEKEEEIEALKIGADERNAELTTLQTSERNLKNEIAELKDKVERHQHEIDKSAAEVILSKKQARISDKALAEAQRGFQEELARVKAALALANGNSQKAQAGDRDELSNQIAEGKQKEEGLTLQLEKQEEVIQRLNNRNQEVEQQVSQDAIKFKEDIRLARQGTDELYTVVDDHIEKVAELLDCETREGNPEPDASLLTASRQRLQGQGERVKEKVKQPLTPSRNPLTVTGVRQQQVAAAIDIGARAVAGDWRQKMEERATKRLHETQARASANASAKHEAEQRAARGGNKKTNS